MIKLLMSLFLLASFPFSINASGHRFIGDVDHPDAVLAQLRLQALKGDMVSSCAYQLYTDLSMQKTSEYLKNKVITNKLIDLGLCVIVDGTLKTREFYISDRLNKIDSSKQMGDPSEK